MKRNRWLGMLVALVGLGGCVQTLQPAYQAKDLIFEPGLLGVWKDGDSSDSRGQWEFRRDGKQGYQLVITDNNGKTGKFQAHLARVDDLTLIDLVPERPAVDASETYLYYLLPTHTFFVVDQLEPELQMRAMNVQWLGKQLEAEPGLLAHESRERDKRLLVTASTKELQQFIRQHRNHDEAFGEPSHLVRLADPR